MFELEVNHARPSSEDLSDEIRDQFQNAQGHIRGVTLLPWEEHCTECAMPKCYETCDLYEPRKDGKCRRFIGGIVPIHNTSNIQNYIVRIAFKRWGQLLAYANLHMIPVARAQRIERAMFKIDEIVSKVPDSRITIFGRRSLTSKLARKIKQAVAEKGYFRQKGANTPDYFLVEIYNPGQSTVPLTLKIFNTEPGKNNFCYQQLLELTKGLNRYKIQFDDISNRVDINETFGIAFTPNILEKSEEGLCLYFGMLTFAWDTDHRPSKPAIAKNAEPGSKKSHVKVVAWDLDNTIWDGVLIEDGAENLKLKPGIRDIIKKLDDRGILNTVVSKNNPDDALAQLQAFGLTEYILHPQIGWGQKGQYLKTLVQQFNVGEDTFAFIDDSPFERDEVLALNPSMRVYDAKSYETLLDLPEFKPPVSSDSNRRRDFYRFEQKREEALSSFHGEYLAFLRDCQIQLSIYTPESSNIDRLQELVQRTNQLNFSGNRYERAEIEKILSEPRYDTFSMDCDDKYGQYGTIGFAIVDRESTQLIDLMFSCRVQAKRVEHAFIAFLLTRYKAEGWKKLSALYNRTDKNYKAGEVFGDLRFRETNATGNLKRYEFDLNQPIPDDKVIRVLWNGKACSV